MAQVARFQSFSHVLLGNVDHLIEQFVYDFSQQLLHIYVGSCLGHQTSFLHVKTIPTNLNLT